MTDPDTHPGHNAPIIHALSMQNAHVMLSDARRHLQFDGTVSARAPSEPGAGQPLRIDGAGQLNGRAASFEIRADPLATTSHEHPYHFSFSERSSGSRLEARGLLPRPFDFHAVDADFEATGLDLKDLYFLTGVRLLDTGRYRLSGKAARRGTHTEYSNLTATFGQSDVRGTVSIDSSSARRKFGLVLKSDVLHLADLGLRAAGRTSEPASSLLLSDAKLSPHVLRIGDATVTFRAQRVDMGRLPLHAVSAKATIDNGVLTVAPLRAEALGGTVDARLVLDARKACSSGDGGHQDH